MEMRCTSGLSRGIAARSFRAVLVPFFAVLSVSAARAQQSIELAGLYQGENLLVVNEPTADGVGFCCYEVRVNGMLTADAVNSHAFEVDLAALGIPLGKGVAVRLKHRSGCAPRVLNAEAIQPAAGFQLVSFEAASSGEVVWTTAGEKGRMPFVLQQYKWGKWVDVVRMDGRGGDREQTYVTSVQPVQGENVLRLTHLAPDGTLAVEGEVRFTGDVPEVGMDYDAKTQVVRFSRSTQYELVDTYGTVVMRGVGSEASVRYLARGEYFVNYGAGTEVLKKR